MPRRVQPIVTSTSSWWPMPVRTAPPPCSPPMAQARRAKITSLYVGSPNRDPASRMPSTPRFLRSTPTWLHSSTMTTGSTKGIWLASRAPRQRIPTRRCSAVESFLTGTAASHRGCMIPGLIASIRSPSPAQISGPRRRSYRWTGRCCLAAAIYSFDVRCSTVSEASR